MIHCSECGQMIELHRCCTCGGTHCSGCHHKWAPGHTLKPVQEKPTTDHAELLKEARELATVIERARDAETVAAESFLIVDVFRKLVDIVEQQDAHIVESDRTNQHADALTIRALATIVARQDKVIAKLVAACKTCDEESETGTCRKCGKTYEYTEAWLGPYCSTDCGRTPDERAAYETRMRQLRICARAEKTLAEARAKYGALLVRLGDTTNYPFKAEPNNSADELWSRIAPKLQRALGFAPLSWKEADVEMAEAEAVPMTEEEIERIAEYATSQPEQPAPAIDWDRYHELLDIMAEKGGLLSPSEQAEYDQFLPITKKLDAKAAEPMSKKWVTRMEAVLAKTAKT